jgi:hypothetical protein
MCKAVYKIKTYSDITRRIIMEQLLITMEIIYFEMGYRVTLYIYIYMSVKYKQINNRVQLIV